MPNTTSIPAPRVGFIDERTGLMSREWYRFFLNLFTLTGSGGNAITLDDVQLGPAVIVLPDDANLVGASNLDSQVAQLAVDLQGLALAPLATSSMAATRTDEAGTAVILSVTDLTATTISTTGTAYTAVVSSTVNTVRPGSRMKITLSVVMSKATNAGTVTFNIKQNGSTLSTPFYSFGINYGAFTSFTAWTAVIATPSSQVIDLEWKRDNAGEVTAYATSTLELTEVYQ
jgi:hypothetical protein